MAQKVTVQLVDDLDGTSSNDITTVSFALDGAEYEIDLTCACRKCHPCWSTPRSRDISPPISRQALITAG